MATLPFDLNLRHLRALIAINEHASISMAASVVNLSQPALTQGLAKLEKQFGYALFERRTSGMVPTPVGDIVSERTRAALDHLTTGAKGLTQVFSRPDRLMTMTQIRAFLALIDAGNFGAAANTTGLSQTAIHRAVGDLEKVIGVALVERRGRGVWVNAAGKRLARGARLAVGELSAAIADVGSENEGEQVSIGALPLSRPLLVPAALARLSTDRPLARFEVVEGSWRELAEPLRDGIIDIIVGTLRPYEVADLRQTPIAEDRLVIAAGSNHPLAGPMMPSIETLAQYPWIVPPKNSPLRAEWEKIFAHRALPQNPIETSSVMIIGRLLTEGQFLTLLSPIQIALQIKAGLLASVGPPLAQSSRTIGVIARHNWRPTTLQRRFIELLHQVGESREMEEANAIATRGWV